MDNAMARRFTAWVGVGSKRQIIGSESLVECRKLVRLLRSSGQFMGIKDKRTGIVYGLRGEWK